MMSEFSLSTNVLLITLDSCRWDTFKRANALALKSRCNFRKAYAQATYTYPAHMSIYSGILPGTREKEPYYNRFKKNLFRIGGRNSSVDSYIEFPLGTENIIAGFEQYGYRTFGCGALEWFKHPNLYKPFQDFIFTGIDLYRQLDYIKNQITLSKQPFFAFINIGETHDPYEHGGQIPPSLLSRERMRSFSNDGFLLEDFNKQISSVEYIDVALADLFSLLEKEHRKTLVVVCSDHGECFGEDGLYGHGFYHPKVMEVPLGIFEI